MSERSRLLWQLEIRQSHQEQARNTSSNEQTPYASAVQGSGLVGLYGRV